eukprot:4767601-Prorocentrum_lima.AAC.1
MTPMLSDRAKPRLSRPSERQRKQPGGMPLRVFLPVVAVGDVLHLLRPSPLLPQSEPQRSTATYVVA